MKLVIMTPGGTVTEEGTQRQLFHIVKKDLEARGVAPAQVTRHLASLGMMAGGIGGATLTDDEYNLVVAYRITR